MWFSSVQRRVERLLWYVYYYKRESYTTYSQTLYHAYNVCILRFTKETIILQMIGSRLVQNVVHDRSFHTCKPNEIILLVQVENFLDGIYTYIYAC